jgi:hypothetical protein
MADPQNPVKTVQGMALYGQAFKFDDVKEQPKLPKASEVTITSAWEKYQPNPDIDYTDIASVNRELVELRIRLNQIRVEMRNADRYTTQARWIYEGKKKRLIIGISGATEKQREAAAELLCEEEYSIYIVALNVAKEIQQHNRDLRSELDLLKEVSNNLRRMIDL